MMESKDKKTMMDFYEQALKHYKEALKLER